jgi:hypothetical protein
VAASLAEAIVQSTNLLQIRLRDEGFAGRIRPGPDECLLECTIFEWFLRAVARSGGFGSKTEAVRPALAARVLIELQSSWIVARVSRELRSALSQAVQPVRDGPGRRLLTAALGGAGLAADLDERPRGG